MKTTDRQEDQWLRGMLGHWRMEGRCDTGDGLSSSFSGQETVRALGTHVVCEGEGPDPEGQLQQSLLLLGFDPSRKCFSGSFACSAMTYLWSYQGHLAGNTLTLDTKGPSMTGDGLTDYQDIIILEGADARRMLSRMKMPDGSWKQIVEMQYQRADA
ncbi:DUF1579 family protein [Pseudoroseomonas globiformis]|uniref:DUF1579 family protein n=1 Tax=Teichococcus globiformis TaxID=2307229 RepID=A0ABV7G4F9_9PROT